MLVVRLCDSASRFRTRVEHFELSGQGSEAVLRRDGGGGLPLVVHQGRIGAASWISSGVIGTPSLQLPLERCLGVFPSAYLQSVPL